MSERATSVTERIGTGILFDLSVVDLDRSVAIVFRCEEGLDQQKIKDIHAQMARVFEHRMREGTLALVVLDRGADLYGMSDEDLAAVGLQRIKK